MTPPIPLTLTFTPQGKHYSVRLASPAVGVHTGRLVLPWGSADIALIVQVLDQLQSVPAAAITCTPADCARLSQLALWDDEAGYVAADLPRRVGQALYRALTAERGLATALYTARAAATAQGTSLEWHLHLPAQPVELAALPWELLWADDAEPLLLSRGRVAACTRYLDVPQAVPPPPTGTPPLRVLLVLPHASMPAALRAEEQAARAAVWQPALASGQLVVETLSPATRSTLYERLHRAPTPTVVHYFGHGRYHDGVGALLLDPEGDPGDLGDPDSVPGDPRSSDDPAWTPASVLTPLLGGVQMVSLFACQGAQAVAPASLLTAVAPAFSAAGVPVVLGMQLTVRTAAATRASDVLYRALIAGVSVQHAVALLRQALYVTEPDQLSWFVPVLYLRSHHTQPLYLLHRPPAPAPAPPLRVARPAIQQHVLARAGSRIVRASLHAQRAAQQQLHADGESTISDTHLGAQ